MACPACGGRLVTKTADRPPRLICSACGRVLPQNVQPGLLAQIDRHATGLLALALLVAMPLVLLALTPWLESSPNGAQWDRRTGIVGRSARN